MEGQTNPCLTLPMLNDPLLITLGSASTGGGNENLTSLEAFSSIVPEC